MIHAEWLNSVGEHWLLLAGHAAWQAAVIGVVALIIVRACPRLPSPVRYWLLVLALLKFAMPPLLSLPTGVFGLVTVSETRVTPAVSPVKADGTSAIAYVERDPRRTVVGADSQVGDSWNVGALPNPGRMEDAESNGASGMVSVLDEVAAGPSQASQEPRLSAAAAILLCHIGGSTLFLVILLVRAIRLHVCTREMKRDPADLMPLLRRCADHLGMRRLPALYVSDSHAGPFSFGVLRPRIVISRGCVERLSTDELQTVVTHELAHHSRGDLIVNAIQLMIGVFWWFHPIGWILNRAIRRVREECCDDMLLSRELVQADPYCSTLLRVADLQCCRLPRTLSVVVSMARTGHPLERRFRRIMDERFLHSDRLSRLSAIVLAAIAVVVLPGVNRGTDRKDDRSQVSATPSDSVQVSPRMQYESDGEAGTSDNAYDQASSGTTAVAGERDADEQTAIPAWPRQLRIRVVDDRGQSVADAPVKLRVDDQEESERRTASDGSVTIELPESRPRRLSVIVDVPPFVKLLAWWYPQRDPKDVPSPELSFALVRGIEIGGRVVDANSQPIAGATIHAGISSTAPRGGPRHTTYGFEATSDARGAWKLGRLPRELNRVYLRVKHADYISDTRHPRSLKGDAMKPISDREHVVVLRKGHMVSGRVTDPDGRPVKGAKIWMGREIWADHDDRPSTDAAGRYEFAHCRQGAILLTVFKPGFAPELKRITIGVSGDTHDFQLKPGGTIRLSVTDKFGQPLSGVRVTPDTWRGVRTLAFPNQHFDYDMGETDASGLWEWTWAPEEKVKYNFRKQGYMRISRKPFAPRDEPYTVGMLPELQISGSVVDDETGEVIEAFRVTPGTTNRPGSRPQYWHRSSTVDARNGRYSISIDHEYDAHAIRIEADGHRPTCSRAIRSDEGKVTLDFRLKRGRQIRGIVLATDGSPAEGANVILGTIIDRPYMRAGGKRDTGRGFSARTDQHGQFEFGAQNADYTVFIFANSGFAHVRKSSFEQGSDKPLEITVKPWGRIEGAIANASGAPDDETGVQLEFAGEMGGQSYFGKHCFFDYSMEADSAGRFVFDRVPPDTEVTVYHMIRIRCGAGWATGRGASASFKLAQGQTRKIKLGLDGRRVIGRVAVRADVQVGWESLFGEFTALDAPADSDVSCRPPTHFRIRQDGVFQIDGVPPGSYRLFIRARKPCTDPHEQGEWIGDFKRIITIPEPADEDTSDRPFGLETLTIYPRNLPEILPFLKIDIQERQE